MRTRILILSGVLVGLLVVAAGAAYAYDQSRKDVIGKGVRAGGVSLQGLTPAQARAKLDRLIMEPLARPIVVHHDKSTWKLGPREARIAVDLDAIVDDAMARSRGGDMFSRTVRNLTGKSLNADLKPTVHYSDRAVVRLLDKVRSRDRPPGARRPREDQRRRGAAPLEPHRPGRPRQLAAPQDPPGARLDHGRPDAGRAAPARSSPR